MEIMKLKTIIFLIIIIGLYLLVIYIIAPWFVQVTRMGHTDGISTGFATFHTIIVMCVILLIVSLILSRNILGTVWPGLIATVVGLLFAWGIDQYGSYRHRNEKRVYSGYYMGQAYRCEATRTTAWHGQSTFYFPDGETVQTIATYKKNRLNGPYREFYENGQMKIDGKFASNNYTEQFFYDGELTGSAKFYLEDGTLDDVRKFEDGRVTYSKNYDLLSDDMGRIISMKTGQPYTGKLNKAIVLTPESAIPQAITGNAVDGAFDGPLEAYDRITPDSIRIAAVGQFENGEQVGQWQFYDKNGEFQEASFDEEQEASSDKTPVANQD